MLTLIGLTKVAAWHCWLEFAAFLGLTGIHGLTALFGLFLECLFSFGLAPFNVVEGSAHVLNVLLGSLRNLPRHLEPPDAKAAGIV